MKKVCALMAGVLMFGFVNAQSTSSEIEMFQSVFSMDKKVMVSDFMKLTDEQGTLFWGIYNAYEAERAELGKRRIDLLMNYAEQYETLTDESAEVLLKEAMSLKKSRGQVRDKYTNKVKKALGAKKAMQFIQFELYIDRAMGMYIMNNIPFVGEFD